MSYRLYGDLGSGAFSRRSGAGRSRRAVCVRADFAGAQRAERAAFPEPQSQRARFRRCACRKARSSPNSPPSCSPWPIIFPKAGCCRRRPRPPAPRPIAGSPSWRARSTPLSRSWIIPARFAPEGCAADALREAARNRVRERLLLIERVLAGPFLLPGGFSLLDIYAAMFSRWSIGTDWRPPICRA